MPYLPGMLWSVMTVNIVETLEMWENSWKCFKHFIRLPFLASKEVCCASLWIVINKKIGFLLALLEPCYVL